MSIILDTLRRELNASDKSLNRLARESGVDVAALSRLASGERGLGVESAEKLAAALGLKITIEAEKKKRSKR